MRLRTLSRTAAGAALLLAVGLQEEAAAGTARVAASGASFHVPVRSLEQRKFESVIRQQYDFSCGSAALATLLTYHYGLTKSEGDVFDAMWAVGDQESIRAKGFSLLDMKLYLDSIGIHADGYRVSLDKVADVGVPTIALIRRRNYTHFVVVRGLTEKEVMIGDPALGSVIVPRGEFESQWNGIAFVIHNRPELGRKHFNLTRDLPVSRKAFLGMALKRETLAAVTILLPGHNEF